MESINILLGTQYQDLIITISTLLHGYHVTLNHTSVEIEIYGETQRHITASGDDTF